MLVYNSARMRRNLDSKKGRQKTYSGCAFKIYIFKRNQLNNYRPFLQLIHSIVM